MITCYREGDLLLRAIESLRNQTIQGFEILVINDSSPDERTNEICRKLQQDGIRVIFRTTNGGLSEARNTGFKEMRGSIAMPLDADDTLPANAVSSTLDAFINNPDVDMVFGDYLIIDELNNSIRIDCSDLAKQKNSLDPKRLARNWKLIGTTPCKKKLWETIEGYSIQYANTVQDVDFWRRALLKGIKGKYIPELLYHWYRSDSGMNNSVTEEQYLPLRLASLPFYDRFHPEYGIEIRQYIYRYFASRLSYTELNKFVTEERMFFSEYAIFKVKLMRFKNLYKLLRKIKNLFR